MKIFILERDSFSNKPSIKTMTFGNWSTGIASKLSDYTLLLACSTVTDAILLTTIGTTYNLGQKRTSCVT